MKNEDIVIDERYLKIIERNNKYVFEVYPRNSKTFCLGTSIEYDNFNDCKVASEFFIKFIIDTPISNESSPFIEIKKEKLADKDWRYRYILMDTDKKTLFYQRYVFQKANAKKGVTSLYNTIDNAYGGR